VTIRPPPRRTTTMLHQAKGANARYRRSYSIISSCRAASASASPLGACLMLLSEEAPPPTRRAPHESPRGLGSALQRSSVPPLPARPRERATAGRSGCWDVPAICTIDFDEIQVYSRDLSLSLNVGLVGELVQVSDRLLGNSFRDTLGTRIERAVYVGAHRPSMSGTGFF
jgi:hypothetical protein